MRFVVVGGGVAGVCCAQELGGICPADSIHIVSADKSLKSVSITARLSPNLELLQLEEKRLDDFPTPNVHFVHDAAVGLDHENKILHLDSGGTIQYDKLCIATGGQPRRLSCAESDLVLTLRDVDSIDALAARLKTARRVGIIGNGGIALELVQALSDVELVWVVRHEHIGDAIFDVDAADFLLEHLEHTQGRCIVQGDEPMDKAGPAAPASRSEPASSSAAAQHSPIARPAARARPGGHAVGPSWVRRLQGEEAGPRGGGRIVLERGAEVASVVEAARGGRGGEAPVTAATGRENEGESSRSSISPQRDANRPVFKKFKQEASQGADSSPTRLVCLTLTNGRSYDCDVVVAALGVAPAVSWVPSSLARAADGGLLVDAALQTSAPDVFAAGDACSVAAAAQSPRWFQMRLWTQARSLGVLAAQSMAGRREDMGGAEALTLFAHATRLVGLQVVLLGLYNGQKLQDEPEEDLLVVSRANQGSTDACFARVVLLRGKVQGAVLVGDTDLEETFENLIAGQLDVGDLGPALLDPNAHIHEIFD